MIASSREFCLSCYEMIDKTFFSGTKCEYLNSIKQIKTKSGVFVTYLINNLVCGSIGTTEQINIHEGITEYSISASMYDFRYPKMTKFDFKNSSCCVSLCGECEIVQKPDDWSLGTHGLKIVQNNKSITMLPIEMASFSTKTEVISHITSQCGDQNITIYRFPVSYHIEPYKNSQ